MKDYLEEKIKVILDSVDLEMFNDIETKSKLLHEIVELYKVEILNERYNAGDNDRRVD